MNEIKINIGDPWDNTCLGKEKARVLFENVPKDADKIIFNFGNILYVGCLFVKEYLLLKESVKFEVEEVNVWAEVQKSFDMVKDLGIHSNDNILIQKFIDAEL